MWKMIWIILISIIIYIASVPILFNIYDKLRISANFWSIASLFTPIINTFLSIRLANIPPLKDFINEINSKRKK